MRRLTRGPAGPEQPLHRGVSGDKPRSADHERQLLRWSCTAGVKGSGEKQKPSRIPTGHEPSAPEFASMTSRLAPLARVLWLAALLSVLVARGAHAEEADYQRTVDAALEEYKLGHFEEARGLFQHAHELEPSARTLRGLGMVEFELRHYVTAIALLEQARSSQVKPLTPEQRTAVEELLARTRHFVAHYQLSLEPSTAEVSLELDGAALTLPADRKLTVSAGEHRLRVSAPGFEPSEHQLDARGGQTEALAIVLRPDRHSQAPRAPEASGPTPPTELASRPLVRPHRSLGIALTGAGAVVLAAGVTLGVIALSKAGEDDDGSRPLAISADVSSGLGALALATGVWLWTRKRPAAPGADASARTLRLESIAPALRVRF